MLLLNVLMGCLSIGTPLAPWVCGVSVAAEPAAPAQPQVASRAWKTIVLHHSATTQGDVASIDAEHRRRTDRDGQPWLGIGYHFVIGNGRGMNDGEIAATFRWQKQLPGAHAGSRRQNETGIGICLIGNFDDAPPTPKQLAAAKKLVGQLAGRYGIQREDVLRHGDVRGTACPGRLFPMSEIAAVVPAADSAQHASRPPSVSTTETAPRSKDR